MDSMLALAPKMKVRRGHSSSTVTKKIPRMGITSLAASTPSLKSASSSLGLYVDYSDSSDERKKPAMGMRGKSTERLFDMRKDAVHLRENCASAQIRERPKSLGALPDCVEEFAAIDSGPSKKSALADIEVDIDSCEMMVDLSQLSPGRFKTLEDLSNVTSTSEQTSTSADTEATLAHVYSDSIEQWVSAQDLYTKDDLYKEMLNHSPQSQYRHLPKWLSLDNLDSRHLQTSVPRLEHYSWTDTAELTFEHMYSRSLSPSTAATYDTSESLYIPEEQIAVQLPPPANMRPSSRWGMMVPDEMEESADLVYDEPPSYPAALRKLNMNLTAPCHQAAASTSYNVPSSAQSLNQVDLTMFQVFFCCV